VSETMQDIVMATR